MSLLEIAWSMQLKNGSVFLYSPQRISKTGRQVSTSRAFDSFWYFTFAFKKSIWTPRFHYWLNFFRSGVILFSLSYVQLMSIWGEMSFYSLWKRPTPKIEKFFNALQIFLGYGILFRKRKKSLFFRPSCTLQKKPK